MRRVLFVVGSLCCVIFVFLLVREDGAEHADFERLSQRELDQDSLEQVDRVAAETTLYEELWQARKGRPLPENLVQRRMDGYFFVGKRGADVGVEIPFHPGQAVSPPPQGGVQGVAGSANPGFVGAESCRSCHEEKYASFVQTAHHLTSRDGGSDAIMGSFEAGKNVMTTHSPDVSFKMIRRGDRSFQRTHFFDWGFEVPFDITLGSSKMAQTYLYWDGPRLFQMNVSYLTSEDVWINSPGYVDGDAAYARPIGQRCLECHVTYIEKVDAPNQYVPDSVIYGISCERCHGPGSQHAEYHKANPQAKKSQHMTVPTDLPRDREIAICSQCHSGISPNLGQAFQFRPGDRISDHYDVSEGETGNSVHTSNQQLRLLKSECFVQSEMTCVDCHNPHQLERGDLKLFSQRCMTCHESADCGMHEEIGVAISDNCIDCHMPKRSQTTLRLDTADASIFPELRDHYIRIDAEQTKRILAKGLFDVKKLPAASSK